MALRMLGGISLFLELREVVTVLLAVEAGVQAVDVLTEVELLLRLSATALGFEEESAESAKLHLLAF